MTIFEWVEIAQGILSLTVLIVTALITAKIADLRASIYKDFLTKRDYFEFQNRRSYNATNRRS